MKSFLNSLIMFMACVALTACGESIHAIDDTNSDISGDTGTPGASGSTIEPDNPGASGSTTDPDNPGASGSTIEPDNPGASGSTIEPDNPGASGSTTDPDNPGESGGTTDPQIPVDPKDQEYIRSGREVFDELLFHDLVDIIPDTDELRPYQIMANEVTTLHYGMCISHGHCRLSSVRNWTGHVPTDNPKVGYDSVHGIDYAGAQDFCHWIGGRLPTEREWEYAATYDGTRELKTLYPWGNEDPELCEKTSWTDIDANRYCLRLASSSHPATIMDRTEKGEYSLRLIANQSLGGNSPMGLVHMAGNMAEFVEEIAMYPEDDPESHGAVTYILKGGSFMSSRSEIQVKSKFYFQDGIYFTNYDWQGVGFRCVIDMKK